MDTDDKNEGWGSKVVLVEKENGSIKHFEGNELSVI